MRSLLLLIVTFVLLWSIHGSVLWSPSELDVSLDGAKNLFTFAWHAEQSQEWFNMDGMSAPYGEHFFYTDGHPLLSTIWRPIVRHFEWYGWSGPLIKWLIAINWLLTPLVIFKLLRHYNTSLYAAFPGAIVIAMLAPQVARAEGHFSLAYTLFIPLVWWWLIRYRQRPHIGYWLLLFALNLCALGTHPYLGLITSGFTFIYLLIPAFWPEKRKQSLFGMLSAIIPLATFVIFLKLTDTHDCRIDDPGGFFEMRSNIYGVLLPQSGPFYELSALLNYKTHWEGRAYIGLAALLLLVLGLIGRFRGWLHSGQTNVHDLRLPLLTAGVLFGIACAQPFALMGEWSLDLVPYLQQFRGIGRLSWPLYFVLAVTAVIVLDTIMHRTNAVRSVAIAAGFFGLWFYEAQYWQHDLAHARKGHQHPISLTAPDLVSSAAEVIAQSGADYIMPLPWFHVGSGFYGRQPQAEAVYKTLSTCYHSGVPTTAAMLTRSSLTEARALIRLLALPRHEKPEIIAPDAVIALLKTDDALERDEQYWWDRGEPLLDSDLSVRLISVRELLYGTKSVSHLSGGPAPCADSVLTHQLREPYSFTDRGHHTVWSFRPPEDWIGIPLELSMEFDALEDGCLEGRGHLKPFFIIQRRDGEQMTWLDHTHPEAASEHAADGAWARPALTFQFDSMPDLVEVFVYPRNPPYDNTVKNLMLRRIDCE